ncbi:MAG: oxygen-independent coproporphyrinogen III oxidase [bacterium]|nr:oxygen-independent coproporphyrinogen III oxidase [bacterium]
MEGQNEIVRLETLRRFDKPGPRYTSYPTAVEFHDALGDEDYRSRLAAVDDKDPQRPLSLYVHLPFCRERCRFCACNVVATPQARVAVKYLDYLKREIDMVAALLPRRRLLAQLHWGGGTPTYFTPEQLAGLFHHLGGYFRLQDGAEVAVEVDPRITTREHLEVLSGLGFNRLSMGVQDFTPEVQAAIGRRQTFDETRDLVLDARAIGFREGINIDLIYGLPDQKVESFADGLERTLELRPDRLAVYSFAYVPWIKVNQRRIDTDTLPSPDVKLELYLTALHRLREAGYESIGMDHFALPDDELSIASREGRLARNFMGYTVKPAATAIAFGITGIGDLETAYFQNHKKLSTYYAALDAGRLPVERGYMLDNDDRIRRWVITQLMCNFRVRKRKVFELFDIHFDDYFSSALAKLREMRDEGFVENTDDTVRVVGTGRLFVRNVAMAFDRYLEAKAKDKPVFSRTV